MLVERLRIGGRRVTFFAEMKMNMQEMRGGGGGKGEEQGAYRTWIEYAYMF